MYALRVGGRMRAGGGRGGGSCVLALAASEAREAAGKGEVCMH